MANTSSAKKRIRVIARKTKIRDSHKKEIKTYVKNIESLISQKDQKTAAEMFKKLDPKLQANGKRKIISKAKISRIQKRLNTRIVNINKK